MKLEVSTLYRRTLLQALPVASLIEGYNEYHRRLLLNCTAQGSTSGPHCLLSLWTWENQGVTEQNNLEKDTHTLRRRNQKSLLYCPRTGNNPQMSCKAVEFLSYTLRPWNNFSSPTMATNERQLEWILCHFWWPHSHLRYWLKSR